MIEGFKLKITSEELKSHCTERAAYHRNRAKTKEEQIPKLREAMEAIKSNRNSQELAQMTKFGNLSSYHTEDPVGDLEKDVTEHVNKSLVFEFFASHLFGEDYTLTESDLQRLEILKR